MTRTPEPGTCEVWWADAADADRAHESLLTAAEVERGRRFVRVADRNRFQVGRVLLRLVLARALGVPPLAVELAAGPHGKPCLADEEEGIQFSVSHSGARLVVAVMQSAPVGVDVEEVRDDLPVSSVAPELLTTDELRALALETGPERLRSFATTWTRKEALVKAVGDGLGIRLDSFAVSAPDRPAALLWSEDPRLAGARMWDLDAGPKYAASLAVLGDCESIAHRDGSHLISHSARAAANPPTGRAPW